MAENRERRDALRDAAIAVLAAEGGRGLTHRAVDRSAGVPVGTAKNYFPSRDALLRGVAERCIELYRSELAGAPMPGTPAGLAALLAGQLARVLGDARPRMLAYQELYAESARRPWLQQLLAAQASADFALHAELHRAAGLPATERTAAITTHCINGVLLGLLTHPPDALAGIGLGDLPRFTRDLLATVYPGGPLAR